MPKSMDLAQEAYAAMEELARLTYHEGEGASGCGLVSSAALDDVLRHLCLLVGSSTVAVQNLIDCLEHRRGAGRLATPSPERWPAAVSADDAARAASEKLILALQPLQAAHTALLEASPQVGDVLRAE
ncbi:MAG: hypothetical protein ACRDN9_18660 [Streptosporangiaceae bacterium]